MSTGGRGVRPPSRLRFGINPIALAELLHGAPASASDWESMEAFLAKVYDLKAGTSELLEGQAEMPARLALFQTLRDVVRDPRKLDAVMALPQARQLIDIYGEQRVARVLPFLVPIADVVFTPDAVATGANDRVVGDYREVDAFDVDAISYLDPLQGAAADCYLIAPLIAVAWAQPQRWAARMGSAHRVIRGPVVRFGFFGGQRTALAPLQIRLRLPVDRGGNLPFARTARREADEEGGVAGQQIAGWPAVVEKAYVMQVRQRTGDPSVADYQYVSDHGRNPERVAQMLIGGRSRVISNDLIAERRAPTQTVRRLCDARGVTRFPVTAWTWDDLGYMGRLRWRSTGLFPNHAYAVLGIMRGVEAQSPGERARDYVVLRNPYGVSVFREETYATGAWRPGPGESGVPEVLLNAQGVFAIASDVFDKSFDSVGWVEPLHAA